MRQTTTLGAFILLLVFTMSLSAQDAARGEELLKWFPQGKYMMVSHRDDLRLAQGDAFELYKQFFEPAEPTEKNKKQAGKKGDKEGDMEKPGGGAFFARSVASISAGRILPKDSLDIPPALLEGLYSVTVASPLSLIDEPEGENDRVQTFALEKEGDDGEEGGTQMGVFIMEKSNMGVYRYHDLDTTIADALKKNQIARVGARIAGRPIYSFINAKNGHREQSQYAWASDTGELIVASDRKTLRKMILAGHGRMQRLTDEPAYVDLVTLLPELGAKWTMHILMDMNRQMATAFEDQGMDDEKLEMMRDRQNKTPALQIESLDVGERLVSKSYRVYEEADAAEAAMDEAEEEGLAQMAGVKPWNDYQLILKKRKKTELRDNIIVSTIEVDEQLLKAEQAANEAMQQQLMQGNGAVTITTGDGKVMKMEVMHAEGDGKDVTINVEKKKK